MELPIEIQMEVLVHLEWEDILSYGLTCHQARNIVSEDHLWKRKDSSGLYPLVIGPTSCIRYRILHFLSYCNWAVNQVLELGQTKLLDKIPIRSEKISPLALVRAMNLGHTQTVSRLIQILGDSGKDLLQISLSRSAYQGLSHNVHYLVEMGRIEPVDALTLVIEANGSKDLHFVDIILWKYPDQTQPFSRRLLDYMDVRLSDKLIILDHLLTNHQQQLDIPKLFRDFLRRYPIPDFV